MTAMDGVWQLWAVSCVHAPARITERSTCTLATQRVQLGRTVKFRIMSGDDTLFAAIQNSSKAASHRPHDNADGFIHAGDTILLRLPTGDIKSSKLEADSCVAFRIVPVKR
jgi:hypothetical protein